MKSKCLYCYKDVGDGLDYHEKCSLSFFGFRDAPKLPYTYSQISKLGEDTIENGLSKERGQQKIALSLNGNPENKEDYLLSIDGAMGGNYYLKPQSETYPEVPQNEHLSMQIAEVFRINVVASSLIKMQSGELSFISQRIDRTSKGKKIHMLNMFQILEAYDKHKSSAEKVGKALGEYSENPLLDKLFFFEICVFYFLIGNNDMHLKNISMIKSNSGWILSPAFDLLNNAILLSNEIDELGLSLDGMKRGLVTENFARFGNDLGLTTKQIMGVFKRFLINKRKAYSCIEQSFLSKGMKRKYKALMRERFAKIYG